MNHGEILKEYRATNLLEEHHKAMSQLVKPKEFKDVMPMVNNLNTPFMLEKTFDLRDTATAADLGNEND